MVGMLLCNYCSIHQSSPLGPSRFMERATTQTRVSHPGGPGRGQQLPMAKMMSFGDYLVNCPNNLCAGDQVGQTALVRGHPLHDHSRSSKHCETAVGNLLGPHLHGILEAERVELEIARVTKSALAARGR